jgi:hypothetical protein
MPRLLNGVAKMVLSIAVARARTDDDGAHVWISACQRAGLIA